MDLFSIIAILVIIATLVIGFYKRFDLVPALVLGNLAIFFIEIFAPQVETDLAFSPIYLTTGENLFTLFTHMFVHAGFLHVLFNMLFLYLIGTPLEMRIGKWRFALVYFIAGFAGVFLETLVIGLSSYNYILGASAAISGAMGAILFLYPRDEIPMFLGPLFLPRVPVWASVGSWFGLQVLFVFSDPNGPVAYAAHIGGFVAGMALAAVMGSNIKRLVETKKGPTSFASLEPLATTPQLKNALEEAKRESQPDVRRVWLEYFAEHANCPNCKGKMKYKGNKLKCACGYEVEIK